MNCLFKKMETRNATVCTQLNKKRRRFFFLLEMKYLEEEKKNGGLKLHKTHETIMNDQISSTVLPTVFRKLLFVS